MNTKKASDPRRHVPENEVDEILKAVWETAARRNPMVLVKMVDPHFALQQLREMIRDCLAEGLSAAKTHDHAVQELLGSATQNTQLHSTCHEQKTPTSS
jgi:hypothetical protein